MRYATTLLLAFLTLTGCAGPKQTAGINDGGAPQEASAITVQMDLSGEAAYRKAAQVLQRRGYSLENTDATLGSIATGWNGVSQRYGADYVFARLNASVSGSALILRGKWRTGEEDGGGQTIRKYGQNGSPAREAWKALHQVAGAFDGELTYQ